MNKELETKLVKKFRFLRKNKAAGKIPYNLFGIECGDGWYKLLEGLCSKIEKEIKKDKLKGFEVAQIKEKFGGLRFYYYGGNDKISELVSKAEDQSLKICEECGKPGKCKDINKWIYTKCKKCENKMKKERQEKVKVEVSPLKIKDGYADGGKVVGIKLPKNWGKVNGEAF